EAQRKAKDSEALHRKKAEDLGEINRRQLVRANVAIGLRFLEEGDALGALLWFCEALRLEGESAREESHRVRIATCLQQCPTLVNVWFHEGGVGRASFSPDGKRVVTGSWRDSPERAARVWDAFTGRPLTPLLTHQS